MKKKENFIPYLKTPFLFFIFYFTIFVNTELQAQSPPTCSQTFNVLTNSWVPQPSRTVHSGDVLCINGTGTYYGVIQVLSGGHVVVCGSATIYGSVSIDPGAS